MTTMAQLDDLHDELLKLLAEGRVTPRYAAEQVGESRQLVSNRLKDLMMGDYVEKVDRGLYEITDRGREEMADDE